MSKMYLIEKQIKIEDYYIFLLLVNLILFNQLLFDL